MIAMSLGYTLAELDARGAQHTAREIAQQPAVWREVGTTARLRRETTEAFLRPLFDRADLRIVLTGAGTSAFAGEILAPALSLDAPTGSLLGCDRPRSAGFRVWA